MSNSECPYRVWTLSEWHIGWHNPLYQVYGLALNIWAGDSNARHHNLDVLPMRCEDE